MLPCLVNSGGGGGGIHLEEKQLCTTEWFSVLSELIY